jgi:SAM-dependent methyltransferase
MNDAAEQAASQADLAASYDRVPYDSQPFSEAHPAYLGALARLHGLDCALPSGCRVLEIGCASGGHLIPLAWYHPRSRFVGIDLSESQIRVGKQLIDEAGLKNCTLRAVDVSCFEPDPTGYDYVIAHGVYSWVPDKVRDEILSLCRRALRPGGVAYISYNTLPGWRMRRLTRDLLEWHLKGVEDPSERLSHAQSLVDHLALVADGGSPGSFLEMEVARIRSHPPSYLAHEYLEPHNRAFLFQEFVNDAAAAGLRYLCNADLGTGYPELYGVLGEAMAGLTDDPLKTEQYLDFVANRAFRQSLLCRDDEPPTGLEPDQVREVCLVADLASTPKLDLRRKRPQVFSTRAGVSFEVQHPLNKAVLADLSRCYPKGINCEQLLSSAARQVLAKGGAEHSGELDDALNEVLSLLVLQHVEPVVESCDFELRHTGYPCATRLARGQASLGWSHLATIRHRCLDLDDFSRELTLRLDGTRDAKALTQSMLEWLTASHRMEDATQAVRLRAVETNVARLLKLFARHGVLEAA